MFNIVYNKARPTEVLFVGNETDCKEYVVEQDKRRKRIKRTPRCRVVTVKEYGQACYDAGVRDGV